MAVTINGTTGIDTPSLTADTTTLVVDETNNRVGIGTASPTKPLHIYGNTSNNHQIRLQNDFGSGADWTLNAYGANGTLYVGNTADRLVIDSAGRVTMPYQPAFVVGRTSSYWTSTGTMDFNQTFLNRGNHWDDTNNKFVAPVDGTYIFTFSGDWDNSGGSIAYPNLQKNGSSVGAIYNGDVGGSQKWVSNTWLVDLSANDEITIYNSVSVRWDYWSIPVVQLNGYLLG